MLWVGRHHTQNVLSQVLGVQNYGSVLKLMIRLSFQWLQKAWRIFQRWQNHEYSNSKSQINTINIPKDKIYTDISFSTENMHFMLLGFFVGFFLSWRLDVHALSRPPTSESQVAGTTTVCHHAWVILGFFAFFVCTGDWSRSLHTELHLQPYFLFFILRKGFTKSLSCLLWTGTWDPPVSAFQKCWDCRHVPLCPAFFLTAAL